MSQGEHLAHKGEILADQATLLAAGDTFQAIEIRIQTDTGEQYSVIGDRWPPTSNPSSESMDHWPLAVDDRILKPWLLPAVFEREQAGGGVFLTELRNAVALFLLFEGIDYDSDDTAGEKLDRFIRGIQGVVTQNGGTLVALIIGDKGSYIYSAFGAPVAHENDARRALNTALEMRTFANELPFITRVQIGVSRGVMRAGAYGSQTRRTYGVLGDEVNLAARLMQAAASGQIIVSGRVQTITVGAFDFDPFPALLVKGKAQPVTVFLLKNIARNKTYHLLDPIYALPIVGRQAEKALIAEKMELAAQGSGQVIGITGEAGLGKSRLVAEAIHMAQRRGWAFSCLITILLTDWNRRTASRRWKPPWWTVCAAQPKRPNSDGARCSLSWMIYTGWMLFHMIYWKKLRAPARTCQY